MGKWDIFIWIKLVLLVTNLEVKGIINQFKGSPPPSVDECDNVIKLQILSTLYDLSKFTCMGYRKTQNYIYIYIYHSLLYIILY